MIFGFNTDIKHDDVVYHVQSEAREGETLLQTQVFVKGRCIGKHAVSYAERAASRIKRAHDRMESQGLAYLEKVRQGFLTEAGHRPDSIAIIDADRPQQEIHAEVLRHAEQALLKPVASTVQNPKSKI